MQSHSKKEAITFPIALKLVVLSSAITIVSLGATTALSTFFMARDMRITAESHNYEVNRLAAERTEEALGQMRIDAALAFDLLSEPGRSSLPRWFFEDRREFAAAALFDSLRPEDGPALVVINEAFMLENGVDEEAARRWIEDQSAAAKRAQNGEALLLNAAPVLELPLAALVYPRREGAALALFSTDALADAYGGSVNSSYLINGDADILVHPNASLAAAGVNVQNDPVVRDLRENPQTAMQTIYTGEDGGRFFGAFTKLAFGNAAVITSVEWNRVFEGVDATVRRNLFLAAAVLFLAAALIFVFSKSISGPILLLTHAARQIEEGEFETVIVSRTRDEIGELTESFGRMSRALGVFGRFTNRSIALRAMRGEIRPGGLLREGTMLFTDIRSFTSTSEAFTKTFGEAAPDYIVRWLNIYFERMVECVEETGGVVDKFIGDALMAHWGTASSSGKEEDAFNCVRAALLMRTALLEMNRDRREGTENPPIRIGCGINSGTVTAGQIGSDRRMEYTVVGDPVNLASRTESLTKDFKTDILITKHTWDLVKSRIVAKEMEAVTVKGKTDPVKIFAVINLRDAEGPRTLGELRTLLGIKG